MEDGDYRQLVETCRRLERERDNAIRDLAVANVTIHSLRQRLPATDQGIFP